MLTGADWSGGIAPAAGDVADIRIGAVWAAGEAAGVNIYLDGRYGAQPSFNLVNGSVWRVYLNDGSVSSSDSSISKSGTFNVYGRSSVTGSISVGSPRLAPDHLTINLSVGSTLVSPSLYVSNRSTLSETSGFGASFENDGLIATTGGSSVRFGSDITGTGQITDGADPFSGGSTIELAGAVSRGQTIAINAGTLIVDHPLQFLGSLHDMSNGSGKVILEGTHATTETWTGTELVLRAGAAIVADLHLTGVSQSTFLFVTARPDGSTAISATNPGGLTTLHPDLYPFAIPLHA